MVARYEKIDITSKNFLFVFVGFMCVYLVLGFCLRHTGRSAALVGRLHLIAQGVPQHAQVA
jgi:hypothetical protein